MIVWKFHPALVFVVWLPFVTLDALYLTSALTKVPSGAWFTLLLAVILASFFTLWRYGKEKQWACEAQGRQQLSRVIAKGVSDSGQLMLADQYGGGEITATDGMGIFFDKSGELTPMVYEQWLRKFRAQMDVVVLMHMRALSRPHVSEEDRFAVARTSVPNVYRVMIRHGYNDHVITPNLAHTVYEEVRKAIIRSAVRISPSSSTSTPREAENEGSAIATELRLLDEAFAAQSLYLVGKEQMRISGQYNVVKRMILGVFLWVRDNCRSRIAKLNVPVEKLVEVGFVGEI